VVATAASASAAPVSHADVFFLRGEQLARVSRTAATPGEVVRRLVAGPTKTESRLGFRTYVPKRTRVNGIRVGGGLATVDVDAAFAAGTATDSLLARLAQLVRTLSGLRGVARVQLLIDGKKVSGVFPGVPTQSPITFAYLQKPNIGVPKPPPARLGPVDPHIRRVQQRLHALGYLAGRDVDGRSGPTTQNGILAFQKWERLDRTGLLDPATEARLPTAMRPLAKTRGSGGKRAEILLDRQVALLILDNHVVRTIAVSSGKPSTPTPPGNYRVYAKIARWWSTPFREWLPWALPFVGGIAFHEFPVVPAYPASHGCVRQAVAVARSTYDFAQVGMPVKVIARS
jgi:hypothetical protein